MAEFWWGDSPKNEIRHHGYYYPSCKGKCEPILQHMLQGLEIDENPLLNPVHEEEELEIVFEDEWLLVVNKPAGMLSVPGKAEDRDSVYHRLKKKYPEATGPMIRTSARYGYFRIIARCQNKRGTSGFTGAICKQKY